MTSTKVLQAVEDLKRSLTLRKDHAGGRIGYHDQLVETMLPIVAKAVAWKESFTKEGIEDLYYLEARELVAAIDEAEKLLPWGLKV